MASDTRPNLLSSVQNLYDYLLTAAPEQVERYNQDDKARVRLQIQSRAVEGAFETTVKFFTTDKTFLPATVLPCEHRDTIAQLMHTPKGLPQAFCVVGAKPGVAVMNWTSCVYDEEISIAKK